MVSVEKVRAEQISEVVSLLDNTRFGNLSAPAWQNLFSYHWQGRDEPYGYVLLDGSKVVGFHGAIFSRRVIDERVEKFCHLAAWYVESNYRDNSLLLLRPFMRLSGYTLLDLTPRREVALLLKRLGFKELDTQLRILLPPSIALRSVALNREQCLVTHDEKIVEHVLTGRDREIIDDHKPYGCFHVFAVIGNRCCHVVYTTPCVWKMKHCYIHYLSDPDMFLKCYEVILAQILSHTRSLVGIVDSRLVLGMKLPASFNYPVRATKLYKSSGLKPEQIDNLYSELILLNSSTLYGAGVFVRQLKETVFHAKART
jgi:hypothetical protein